MQEEAAHRQRVRPLVLPEPYAGEGDFSQWHDHFQSVTAVNEWSDAEKLHWLRVRLTGRTQTALRRLSEATGDGYTDVSQALKERFEPASKKELHIVEFQTRKRQRGEGWADFGDVLRILADKVYPGLELEAWKRLSLNRYLEQLADPQVAFGVGQACPKTIQEAAAATLQMESYTLCRPAAIAKVTQVGLESEITQVGAISERLRDDPAPELLRTLMEKIETLEAAQRSRPPTRGENRRDDRRDERRYNPRDRERHGQRSPPKIENRPARQTPGQNDDRRPVTCLQCGKEGHYARGCAVRRPKGQGNRHATDQACEGDPRKVSKPPDPLSSPLPISAPPTSLSFFSVSPTTAYRVDCTVNSIPATFIVDTGAATTLL